jgi:hypothetical protein
MVPSTTIAMLALPAVASLARIVKPASFTEASFETMENAGKPRTMVQ